MVQVVVHWQCAAITFGDSSLSESRSHQLLSLQKVIFLSVRRGALLRPCALRSLPHGCLLTSILCSLNIEENDSTITSPVHVLDHHSRGATTAVADGSNAVLGLVLLQHVEQSDDDAAAAGTDGVSERNSTAKDVDPGSCFVR